MKKMLTSSPALAATLLLGLGTCGAATLGNLRGDAWVGQPLEVTVPATFAAAEGDGCVKADVFYGDTRLDPSRVRATVLGAGSARHVRVEAEKPVDEPVVTVKVRAGCGNTFSRSYTMLPDLPSPAMLAAAPVAPRTMQAGGVLATSLARLPSTHVAGAASARDSVAKRSSARGSAAEAPRPRVRSVAAAKAAPAARRGPRLVVEAWEPEPQAMLRTSLRMADAAGDPGRRATAALLWQALNAGPEQLLRTSASIRQMEGELAQLRQTAGQTHDEVLALRQRLDATQASPIAVKAARLLVLLLLLAGGAAAWLWLRNQRASAGRDWSGAPLAPLREQATARALQAVAPAPLPTVPPVAPPVTAPPLQPPPQPMPAPAPVMQAGAPASAMLLRVETLAATFDEVQFLCSLALWDDAIELLKSYIEDSTAPAPLAYFELMRLCVETDDAASLVAVRKRYRRVYGVESPKFEQIQAPLGLEGHPELAQRIAGAWRTGEALDAIELSLFMVPSAGKACSLQAGRDLLFLHALALTLRESDAAGAAAQDAGAVLAPWAHADNLHEAQHALQAAADGADAHRYALDLDLGAPGEPEFAEPEFAEPALAAPVPESRPAALLEEEDAFSIAVASERARRN